MTRGFAAPADQVAAQRAGRTGRFIALLGLSAVLSGCVAGRDSLLATSAPRAAASDEVAGDITLVRAGQRPDPSVTLFSDGARGHVLTGGEPGLTPPTLIYLSGNVILPGGPAPGDAGLQAGLSLGGASLAASTAALGMSIRTGLSGSAPTSAPPAANLQVSAGLAAPTASQSSVAAQVPTPSGAGLPLSGPSAPAALPTIALASPGQSVQSQALAPVLADPSPGLSASTVTSGLGRSVGAIAGAVGATGAPSTGLPGH